MKIIYWGHLEGISLFMRSNCGSDKIIEYSDDSSRHAMFMHIQCPHHLELEYRFLQGSRSKDLVRNTIKVYNKFYIYFYNKCS